MTDRSAQSVAAPRVAATLLLLRDNPFQVLMVRRRRGGSFSSALVFPGGRIEDEDADPEWRDHLTGDSDLDAEQIAIRIGAIRETFEEADVLLGARGDAGRFDVDRSLDFRSAVAGAGVVLDVSATHPFSRWITPELEARRFDTHFLLARMPGGQQPHPDENETVAFEWVSPAEVVGDPDAAGRTILFPTLMNLTRLAESDTVDAAIAAADQREVVEVLPVMEPHPDGFRVTLDPAAGYGSGGHVIPGLMTRA